MNAFPYEFDKILQIHMDQVESSLANFEFIPEELFLTNLDHFYDVTALVGIVMLLFLCSILNVEISIVAKRLKIGNSENLLFMLLHFCFRCI